MGLISARSVLHIVCGFRQHATWPLINHVFRKSKPSMYTNRHQNFNTKCFTPYLKNVGVLSCVNIPERILTHLSEFQHGGKTIQSHGSVRGMAGHSKWANIRHIKAEKDNQKAKITSEVTSRLRAFMKETGQTDPKKSSQLAKMIADAKSKNIPNATIDRILSQMVNMKNTPPFFFEAKGPAGSAMIIEAVTNKIIHTRGELQAILKKCGFTLFDVGSSVRQAFEEKGVVLVDCEPGVKTDADSYVDVAIEAGAEEVTVEEDGEDTVLQFTCAPQDTYKVKKELESRQLLVRSAEIDFIPTTNVPLDNTILEAMDKAMSKLEEHPNVIKVYTNVVEAS